MENHEETLKKIEEQADKVDEIAKLYNIDNGKVKELFLNCPQLIDRSVAFYLEYKISKDLFDRHWLYDCIRTLDDFCSFGGYRTFENFCTISGDCTCYDGCDGMDYGTLYQNN